MVSILICYHYRIKLKKRLRSYDVVQEEQGTPLNVLKPAYKIIGQAGIFFQSIEIGGNSREGGKTTENTISRMFLK